MVLPFVEKLKSQDDPAAKRGEFLVFGFIILADFIHENPVPLTTDIDGDRDLDIAVDERLDGT